jgi:hypothetical protein
VTKLTFENAFLGAKILNPKKEEFFIYKINQKTLYYGKLHYSTISIRWENKSPDLTWKKLMENAGGVVSGYENLFLSDTQEDLNKIKKASELKKEKRYLTSTGENEVKKLFGRFKNKKGSWRHQVELSREIFNIVDAKEEGIVLLSVDGSFIFYNLNNKKYTYWKSLGVPKIGVKESIPWDKAS